MAGNDVTIDIRVTGTAEAIAKLNLLGHETKKNVDETRSSWNKINSTIGGLLQNIPLVGQGLSGMGAAGLPVLAALAAVLVAILGYVAAMIPELVAAGAGFAAFAALAYPSLQKIIGGVQAVDAASTQAARNKAWKSIPDALRPAVQTILDVKNAFEKLATFLQPLVGRIVSTVGDIAKKILPDLLPLAEAAGRAIEGLLKQFDRVAGSQGFKSFIGELTKLSGPAITAIGRGLGTVMAALGTFLKELSSPQGIVALNGFFGILAGSIRGLGVALQGAEKFGSAFARTFLAWMRLVVSAAHAMADGVLGAVGAMLHGLAAIPGPQQAALKKAAAGFDSFRASADQAFNGAMSKLNDWQIALRNAPKIVKLQGDITDLQNKLAIANQQLRNPNLTATRRANIEANITQLELQLARARAALNAINGTVATTYVQTIPIGGGSRIHAASGGIIGQAAAGGLQSNLVMVGEHGAELVSLPPGSQVHSNPDSQRMLSQSGGGASRVVLEVRGGQSEFDRFMAKWIQRYVRTQGGGDVQAAFGGS